jgi:hypothetical protein
MRNLFVLVLLVAAVALGAWWVQGHMSHSRAYAPETAQDTELGAQPAPEPAPPAPPPEAKADRSAELPKGPVPYDQLKKGDEAVAAAEANTPPKNNSNDKAIFY